MISRSVVFFLVACMLAASPAAYAASSTHNDVGDPWESVNRRIFWFNDQFDVYFLEPVAKGWRAVLPDVAEIAIGRFFDNMRAPVDFANNVLQGKAEAALTTLGRFTINTTMGLGGFLDPASHAGLDRHVEDFGQTLGHWGTTSGPYLVLPFLGPSTVRDAVGSGTDSLMYIWPYFVDDMVTIATATVYAIDARASLLDVVASTKRSSFDYYAFVRNAYLQRRRVLVTDRPESPEEEEDLYYFDTEDE